MVENTTWKCGDFQIFTCHVLERIVTFKDSRRRKIRNGQHIQVKAI